MYPHAHVTLAYMYIHYTHVHTYNILPKHKGKVYWELVHTHVSWVEPTGTSKAFGPTPFPTSNKNQQQRDIGPILFLYYAWESTDIQ